MWAQWNALGGAVYVGEENGPLTFKSQNQNLFFSGNYTKDVVRGKNYNAIFLDTYNLAINHVINFDTSGGGAWIVNDSIEGADTISWDMEGKIDYSRRYNLAFTGDGVLNENGLTDQYVSINNDIINAGEVTVEGTTLRFGAYQHEDKTANNWDGHGRFVASLNKDGTVNLDAEVQGRQGDHRPGQHRKHSQNSAYKTAKLKLFFPRKTRRFLSRRSGPGPRCR